MDFSLIFHDQKIDSARETEAQKSEVPHQVTKLINRFPSSTIWDLCARVLTSSHTASTYNRRIDAGFRNVIPQGLSFSNSHVPAVFLILTPSSLCPSSRTVSPLYYCSQVFTPFYKRAHSAILPYTWLAEFLCGRQALLQSNIRLRQVMCFGQWHGSSCNTSYLKRIIAVIMCLNIAFHVSFPIRMPCPQTCFSFCWDLQ